MLSGLERNTLHDRSDRSLDRRNAIVVFMCIELMLNAVNITFIALSRFLQSLDGVLFAFFVIAVAAAEAAVGLAIFVMIYRSKETINVDEINILKWCPLPHPPP